MGAKTFALVDEQKLISNLGGLISKLARELGFDELA